MIDLKSEPWKWNRLVPLAELCASCDGKDAPEAGCEFCHGSGRDTTEPFLVPPGWDRSVFIPHTNGPTYRVLFYDEADEVRFEHRCDRGERGVIICAPLLQIGHGHTLTSEDPLTITPSILCSDCGTHGFIENGRWRG